MRICIPYHKGNIGRAYNQAMIEAPRNEWIVLMDGDVLMLTPNWFDRLERVLASLDKGKVGLLTCVTNRTMGLCQQAMQWHLRSTAVDDIQEHRRHAELVAGFHKLIDCTNAHETYGSLYGAFSGFFMATHSKAWKAAGGFEERKPQVRHVTIRGKGYHFTCNGFTGVDTAYYLDVCAAGYKTVVAPGLYCYHGRFTSGAC